MYIMSLSDFVWWISRRNLKFENHTRVRAFELAHMREQAQPAPVVGDFWIWFRLKKKILSLSIPKLETHSTTPQIRSFEKYCKKFFPGQSHFFYFLDMMKIDWNKIFCLTMKVENTNHHISCFSFLTNVLKFSFADVGWHSHIQ